MTTLDQLLLISRIQLNAPYTKKSELMQAISLMLGESKELQEHILDKLDAREQIGSTGIGHGVAIPHARIGKDQISSATGAFIRLEQATEFMAADDEPVDLIFALIVPKEANEDYLRILASLAKFFNNENTRAQLRQLEDKEDILKLFMQHMAA